MSSDIDKVTVEDVHQFVEKKHKEPGYEKVVENEHYQDVKENKIPENERVAEDVHQYKEQRKPLTTEYDKKADNQADKNNINVDKDSDPVITKRREKVKEVFIYVHSNINYVCTI